ncbi:hypothetical protein HAX54_050633 [Datura stramonium]|uniref:Uncharacterized protein n=1 Tax=Datura stramonium TaxID=4076 RepID=A0ABS8SXE6_DATST|nr:hypothetical protein [Datura stramonium]
MVFPSPSHSCLTTLWSKIDAQGWTQLFYDKNAVVAKDAIVDFFNNFSITRECITSRDKWPDFPPPLKPLDIVQKFSRNPSRTSESKESRDAASYLDLTLMELLDREMPINFPGLIVSYLSKGTHPAGGLGGTFDIASSLQSKDALDVKTLLLGNERLRMEIEQLKGQLTHNEETAATHHTNLLTLIQSLSPCAVRPFCSWSCLISSA